MDYSKYYDLENYLFNEVRGSFNARGYLIPEEFFCVVIWKANRAKTKIKNKLLNYGKLNKIVKDLTSQIYKAKSLEEKMRILIEDYKFGYPMASAVLSVLYPDDFTVYDYRVVEQLNLRPIYSINKYFSYFLPKVKAYTYGKKLRDKDKYLWGKSFYEDLLKFLR